MGKQEKMKEWVEQFTVCLPYPEVCVEYPNCDYARAMLDNVGGCNSEMSAVALYLYNHFITHNYPELALAFHKISIVEMHHLEIFGELALQLGEDPRLWTQKEVQKAYWTPAYNQYPRELQDLLENAIQGERAAIHKYQQQLQWISDCGIRENLHRIILDEDSHVQLLCALHQKFIDESNKKKHP